MRIENFLQSLSVMGMGMLGIFIVIGVIMACVWGLCKAFPDKTNGKD